MKGCGGSGAPTAATPLLPPRVTRTRAARKSASGLAGTVAPTGCCRGAGWAPRAGPDPAVSGPPPLPLPAPRNYESRRAPGRRGRSGACAAGGRWLGRRLRGRGAVRSAGAGKSGPGCRAGGA